MEIFTTGYPRAGSTWLNRLLSDLYSSPLQAKPGEPVEYFGPKKDGFYVIRKTHWRADEYPGRGYGGNSKIVLIQRDPRDLAVSAMYYSKAPSLMHALQVMCNKELGHNVGIYHILGYYEHWHRGWFESGKYDVATKYENLHYDPVGELKFISLSLTGDTFSTRWIEQVVERQNFDKWSAKYPHSMRKGIVGDWKSHFTKVEGEYITDHLGQFMIEQGYIEDLEWWQECIE